jgi:N-acetylglutamate synthase-like GNAT family acetyltransferase
MDVLIRDIEDSDYSFVCKMIRETVEDAYKQNDIKSDDLEEFINEKIAGISNYLKGHSKYEKYKVVVWDSHIIGIGGIYKICESIKKNIKEPNEESLEIGSINIKRNFQKKGINKVLMKVLINEIQKMGIDTFYLDCGYSSSQKYWMGIFGEPEIRINSYFSKNEHYMIWKIKTQKAIELYSNIT